MRASATVRDGFSASHSVANDTLCSRGDGHDWQVAVTIEAELSPKTGMVVDPGALRRSLGAVLAEIDHRNLNDMLPGVAPTAEGIAAWVRERLLMDFPSIRAISVANGLYEATLEWVRR